MQIGQRFFSIPSFILTGRGLADIIMQICRDPRPALQSVTVLMPEGSYPFLDGLSHYAGHGELSDFIVTTDRQAASPWSCIEYSSQARQRVSDVESNEAAEHAIKIAVIMSGTHILAGRHNACL
jgi:hypothetical protein